MSSYMLIHGDCMDSFGLIHDHSVNLVLADPPYGITQNTWDVVLPFDDFIECDGKNLNYEKYLLHCFKKNIPYKDANEEWNKRKQQGIWSQLDRILADRGVVILFSAGIYTKTLMESTTIPWRYNLIWQKTTPVGFLNANRMPLRAHEDILVFYKKLPTYNPQKTTGHPRKVSTVEHKRNSKMTDDYGKYTAKGYDSTERFPTSVLTCLDVIDNLPVFAAVQRCVVVSVSPFLFFIRTFARNTNVERIEVVLKHLHDSGSVFRNQRCHTRKVHETIRAIHHNRRNHIEKTVNRPSSQCQQRIVHIVAADSSRELRTGIVRGFVVVCHLVYNGFSKRTAFQHSAAWQQVQERMSAA